MEAVVAVSSTVRTRTAVPGAVVDLWILASGRRGAIGVDLDSGAFVRARYTAPAEEAVRPFEVMSGTVADVQDEPDPTRPEALVLDAPLTRRGQLRGRSARRILRPLVQPRAKHLLGFPGPAVPFWTLTEAVRPSVALVAPEKGPSVAVLPGSAVPHIRFRWSQVDYDLPLQDRRLEALLARTGMTRVAGGGLAQAVGGPPAYLLVTLTPPCEGHCYKVVAGVVPKP